MQFDYLLRIPVTIDALTPSAAQVLADWLARTSQVEECVGELAENPLGPYRISSGLATIGCVHPADAPSLQAIQDFALQEEQVVALEAAADLTEAVSSNLEAPTEASVPEQAGSLAKERRRCTKEWLGCELVTAGISPTTIALIEDCVTTRADLPAAKALLEGYLSRFTRPSLTVLREEEGGALLGLLDELAATAPEEAVAALPTVEPPVEFVTPDGWPAEYPPLGTRVATKFGEGVVTGLHREAGAQEHCVLLKMLTGTLADTNARFYLRELAPVPLPPAEPAAPQAPQCEKAEDPASCAACAVAPVCLAWKVYQNQQEAAQTTTPRPPWLR